MGRPRACTRQEQTGAERGGRDAESQGVELSLSLYCTNHLHYPSNGVYDSSCR